MISALILLLGTTLFRLSTDSPLVAEATGVPNTSESTNAEETPGQEHNQERFTTSVTTQNPLGLRVTTQTTPLKTSVGGQELSSIKTGSSQTDILLSVASISTSTPVSHTHIANTPQSDGSRTSETVSGTEFSRRISSRGADFENGVSSSSTVPGRRFPGTGISATTPSGFQNMSNEDDENGGQRGGTDRTSETWTRREEGGGTNREIGDTEDTEQRVYSESSSTHLVSQSPSSIASVLQRTSSTESPQDTLVTRVQSTRYEVLEFEENDASNNRLVDNEEKESQRSSPNASENSQKVEASNHIVWFLMTFRGNCDLLNVTLNSTSLKTAFHRALISLLLYNASHVTVTKISCIGVLSVNVSIDAYFYPNCEQDLRLLEEHDNINLRIKGVLFNLITLETSRDLIFSTREVDMLSSGDGVLLIILGAIGIAAIGLGVAAFFYVLIQVFLRRKREYLKSIFAEASVEPRSETSLAFAATQIPRPRLRVKTAEQNGVDRSSQVSSMYKSYVDLTCPELYASRDAERVARGEAVTPIGDINGIIVSTNDHIIQIKNHDYDDPTEDTPDGPTVRFDIPEEASRSQYSNRRRGEMQRHSMKAISNNNLFLTKVTFLGEDNPAFRIETNL
ncbi:uncharacterized protein LOC143036468 [Oratosquilla oratoria]|uniref:uncharacterized protein LOC143036468 n=1 Tax=Oratosquilla oratoria TaxID=337810 RepID=UPI003F75BA18